MNAGALLPGNDGVCLPYGTRVAPRPHASRGGRPYGKEMREYVIALWSNLGQGDAALEHLRTDPGLLQLRAQHKFPHFDTCKRWIRQFELEGHVRPKRATGNRMSESEVRGVDLVNLAIFRMVHPKAYQVEAQAYIHNRNPANRPYSLPQITRAEQRLGLWLKVGSTTSDDAYRPVNIRKRKDYWRRSYPRGINDQDTARMIDIDEARFKLESQNRIRGKVTKQKRVDARGKYKKGAGGINLLMGVSGDDQDPFEFHQMFSEGGTDLYRFYRFMEAFIDWLDVNRPGITFCFTMDNLNIHKHPMVLDLIEDSGHRVVFRAPYWSCDGPIEYVFNTIHVKLQMDYDGVDNVQDLRNKLDNIIFHLVDAGFRPYFVHVGFP